MGNQVIVTHQIAHAIDVGYANVFAASIFGLMGVISIAGRIGFGYLADVMNRQAVFAWVQIVSAVGIFALLAMHDASTPWLLYLYAVCYGLGQGSRALVLSAISADIFQGQALRRDLRLLHLQHRHRRRHRRLARRVSF
jgi:MFS family permease